MIKKIVSLFIFLSFVTIPVGGIDNTNPILSRITISDLFGILGLFLGFKQLILGFISFGKKNKIYNYALFMVFLFLLPVGIALNPENSIFESLIIVFLVLISILISKVYEKTFFTELIPVIINCSIAAVLVGFYDVAASVSGLPRLFKARASGEVISAFRNAGQAGAYFLVMLSILLPLYFSKIKQELSSKYQKRLLVSIILSVFFLLATGKIAAYIGLFIGWNLFLIKKRDFKSVFFTIASVIIGGVLFLSLEEIAPDFYERIVYKFDSRIMERYRGTKEESFLEKNLGAAIEAFIDNPYTGTGLGGVNRNYSDHEVHSTYMKMLGETGLLGVFGYIMFIMSFVRLFKNKLKQNNPYQEYLILSYPFIIGCLVSWGYTYHLRKREFWILLSVFFIVNILASDFKNKKINS